MNDRYLGFYSERSTTDDDSDTRGLIDPREQVQRKRRVAHTQRRVVAQKKRRKSEKEQFTDVMRRVLVEHEEFKDLCIRWTDKDPNGQTPMHRIHGHGLVKETRFTLNALRRRIGIESGMALQDNVRYYTHMIQILEEHNRHFYPDYSQYVVFNQPLDNSYSWRLEGYVDREEHFRSIKPKPVLFTEARVTPEAAINVTPSRLFQVFRDQKWTTETAFLYFVLMGRWFYGRGRPDNWHVLPYDLGVAGAGKGVLMNVKKSTWPGELCADLQYGDRSDFKLGDCQSAEVCYINEAENVENAPLSIALLNKMAAGEDVSCNRKYGGKTTIKFWLPIWMNGNTMLRYRSGVSADEGLSRRLVPFPFLYKINDTASSNTNLDHEIIQHEMPQIIVQSTTAYHQFLRDIGKRPFPLSRQMKCFHKTTLSQTPAEVWFFRLCLTRVPDSALPAHPLTFREVNERFSAFYTHFGLFPKKTELTPDMIETHVKAKRLGPFRVDTYDGVNVVVNAIWRDYGDDWLQGGNPANVRNFKDAVLLSEAEEAALPRIPVPEWFRKVYEDPNQ